MAIGIIDRNSTPSPLCRRYDVTLFDSTIYTTVTHRADAVNDWIGNIKSVYRDPRQLMVGLDVERRPASPPSSLSPIAVLQLCVADLCLVFQIFHSGFPIPIQLANFLSGNSPATFVGVGIKKVLEDLEVCYGIGRGARWVDLRDFAADKLDREKLKNVSRQELGKEVLGRRVEKPLGVIMSRWDDRELTAEQVQYACVDAFMCREIGMVLGIMNQ